MTQNVISQMNGLCGWYESTDAWLLYAIALTSQNRAAELHEVISAGDFINHAIFTYEELRGGVRRLSSGGWIKGVNGRWRVTPKLRKVYTTLSRSVGKALTQLEAALREQTKMAKPVASLSMTQMMCSGISSASFADAVRRYHQVSEEIETRRRKKRRIV